jgi:hypothetical protein
LFSILIVVDTGIGFPYNLATSFARVREVLSKTISKKLRVDLCPFAQGEVVFGISGFGIRKGVYFANN